MKILILFALVSLVVVVVAADDYSVLQKVDFTALAENTEEFRKYKDCIVNKGPCNEIYQPYKDHLPEGMREACKKCSPEQKHNGNVIFETIKTRYPEDYVLLQQIYDPENKYLEAMVNEMSKYKTI